MRTPTRLGERLRIEREKRGMTREALALALDESPPTVRGWEKGFSEPRPEKLAKIEAWIKGGSRR